MDSLSLSLSLLPLLIGCLSSVRPPVQPRPSHCCSGGRGRRAEGGRGKGKVRMIRSSSCSGRTVFSLSSAPSSPASSTPTSVGCRASIGRRKKERPLPRRGPKTAMATKAAATATTRRDEIVAPGPPPLLLRLHSLPLPLRVCACV